jgi:hypothetical protein
MTIAASFLDENGEIRSWVLHRHMACVDTQELTPHRVLPGRARPRQQDRRQAIEACLPESIVVPDRATVTPSHRPR